MTTENSIEARGLTRKFGDLVAVDDVSFAIPRGEIFAFLGPNGAGKTTTLRMLTGLLPPTSGRAIVAGYDMGRQAVRARRGIGVVPENANIYVDLSVWRNLMLMAELYGVGRRERERRGEELLERFALWDRKDSQGRTLSKGLRQRLMLCMALVSGPEILFLDEPTVGLDVASARLIRQLIHQYNQQGVTVFLTSHNLTEVEELASRVAIINQGRLAAIATPDELRAGVEAARFVEVTFVVGGLNREEVEGWPEVHEVEAIAGGLRVRTDVPGRLAQKLLQTATEWGLEVNSVNTRLPSLEEVFVAITDRTRPGPSTGSAQREERG